MIYLERLIFQKVLVDLSLGLEARFLLVVQVSGQSKLRLELFSILLEQIFEPLFIHNLRVVRNAVKNLT